MILTLLKRFWSCRVRGVHSFGRAHDRLDTSGCPPVMLSYKTCRLCGTVRAVRRRKGKG